MTIRFMPFAFVAIGNPRRNNLAHLDDAAWSPCVIVIVLKTNTRTDLENELTLALLLRHDACRLRRDAFDAFGTFRGNAVRPFAEPALDLAVTYAA